MTPLERHINAVKQTARGSENLTAFLFDSELTLLAVEGPLLKKYPENSFRIGLNLKDALPAEFVKPFLNNCIKAAEGKNSSQEREYNNSYYAESFIPLMIEKGKNNVMVVLHNLSDLKLFQKLKEHRSIFENLYKHCGFPMAFYHPDGKISMANEEFCDLLGYTEEELLTLSFKDITTEDDLEIEMPLFIELLEGKRDRYDIEKKWLTKSGDIKWIKARVSCYRDESGEINYFMAAVNDITEDKQDSIKLKYSEQTFKNIFENNAVGMYVVDENGIIVMCNNRFANFLGYDKESIVNQSVQKIISQETSNKVVKAIKALYSGENSFTLRKEYIKKDGSLIYGEMNGSIYDMPNDDGSYILGVVKDITGQIEAEKALLESEEKFRKIFENNGLAVTLTNKKGNYLMCNQGMSDFVGYTQQELEQITTLDITVKEEVELVAKELRKLTRGKEKSVTVRKRYVTKSGKIKWGDLTVTILNDDGDDTIFLGVVQDVTAQLNAELALKESEKKFRKIFENNAIGIATANTDGYYTLCNKGFEKILGYTQKELSKLTSTDITHPDDKEETDEKVRDLLTSKIEDYTQTKRYITKSGKVIWGEVTVSAFKNPENDEITLVGVLNDITETKQAEKALKESEEKFRKIFENNGLGVAILNQKGEYLQINKGAEEILGYTQDEMVGKTNLDITHPDDLDISSEHLNKLLANKIDSYNLVKRYITKDRRTIWGDITVSMMKLSSHKEPMLIGVMHEITEQKEIEERFRKIFENNGLAVLVVDSDGKYVMINKGAEDILGYTIEEFESLKNKDITHPDDIGETNTKFEQIKSGEISSYNIQKRYITKKGKVIWGDITVSPMGISEGGNQLFIGVIQDITIQKEAEQELKITNAELKTLSEELLEHNLQLENFAHITSHNLRGPLSNLIMLSDVYKKTESTETRETLVEKFKLEANRMLKTLDLLAEQIHTRKRANVVMEKLRFSKIYKATISSLSELIETAGVSIKTNFECKSIEYPKAYIDSIFLNLISNAVKYRSPDRKSQISIKTYAKDGEKYLEIADNGMGINMDRNREKIFGLYKTFHNHPDSRGVGLFLIKNQVESLGGDITVESEPNKGTTFTIRF